MKYLFTKPPTHYLLITHTEPPIRVTRENYIRIKVQCVHVFVFVSVRVCVCPCVPGVYFAIQRVHNGVAVREASVRDKGPC